MMIEGENAIIQVVEKGEKKSSCFVDF